MPPPGADESISISSLIGLIGDAGVEPLPVVPNYEILQELNRGAQGVVYKARDIVLDRTVALKMIHGMKPGDVRRFNFEATTMASVKAPNVAQVFSAGNQDGKPFLVMEYLDCGTLADMLQEYRLDPHVSALVVAKIADGVGGARQGDHPSGSEARQRPVQRAPRTEGHRLRVGQTNRNGPDEYAGGSRYAAVHGT